MADSVSDIRLRKSAEQQLVAIDIQWAWRFVADAVAYGDSMVPPLLCVMQYLSLIVHESYRYFEDNDPVLAQALQLQNADVIAQSRHRVKLFDDNRLGMEGVADYFSEELMAAHRKKFIKSVRLPFAGSWTTDLGICTYAGLKISTTHVVNFNLGTSPDMVMSDDGSASRGVGQDIGAYFSYLAEHFEERIPQLDWAASSFLSKIDANQLVQKDVRSKTYYRDLFGGKLPIGILAALDTFRCTLNTINSLISADSSPGSAEAQFKIRFITLYHVLQGLRQLRAAHADDLGDGMNDRLEAIEDHPTSTMLRTSSSRKLRNNLVHYGIRDDFPAEALDFDQPLVGLSEYFLPSSGFAELAAQLQDHTKEVAGLLEDWAG